MVFKFVPEFFPDVVPNLMVHFNIFRNFLFHERILSHPGVEPGTYLNQAVRLGFNQVLLKKLSFILSFVIYSFLYCFESKL